MKEKPSMSFSEAESIILFDILIWQLIALNALNSQQCCRVCCVELERFIPSVCAIRVAAILI
jgi:hypothetical protein